MSLADRRKNYKCGANYSTVADIETWADYYAKNKDLFLAQFSEAYPLGIADPGLINVDTCDRDKELNKKVSLFFGDITTLEIDAIVNAANNKLIAGGGVDGAIHRAAGSLLQQKLHTFGGCETGEAIITPGYNLPAKNIIHTVGPVGERPYYLRFCYERCMERLIENNLTTIAFPCISTGVYGYPRDPAARIALVTVRKFMEKHRDKIDRVIFCLFLDEDKLIYTNLMQAVFPTVKTEFDWKK